MALRSMLSEQNAFVLCCALFVEHVCFQTEQKEYWIPSDAVECLFSRMHIRPPVICVLSFLVLLFLAHLLHTFE